MLVPLRSDASYVTVTKTTASNASAMYLTNQVLGYLPSAPFTNVRLFSYDQIQNVRLAVQTINLLMTDITVNVPSTASAILCNIYVFSYVNDHMVHSFGRSVTGDTYTWDNQVLQCLLMKKKYICLNSFLVPHSFADVQFEPRCERCYHQLQWRHSSTGCLRAGLRHTGKILNCLSSCLLDECKFGIILIPHTFLD